MVNFLPSLVRQMKRKMVVYREGLVEWQERNLDIENSDPKLHHYTWNPWRDCADATCSA